MDNVNFGNEEHVEPDWTLQKCKGLERKGGMPFDECSPFFSQSDWVNRIWDFENNYQSWQCEDYKDPTLYGRPGAYEEMTKGLSKQGSRGKGITRRVRIKHNKNDALT